MGDMQDPINLRLNPCYSVTEVPEETEDMNYNYNFMYEYVENGSESSMSVETSGHKLTRNTKKRMLLVGCITIIVAASITFSVIAFALNFWSADKAKFALGQVNNSLSIHVNDSYFTFGDLTNAVGAVQNTLRINNILPQFYSVPECGPGKWQRVVYLNMNDSSQQCPTAWREYTTPVRSCSRPVSSTGSCASTVFSVRGINYNKLCGRAIGYQYGVSRGFGYLQHRGIDEIYVDGISVTHGNPRSHIWTFAAGRYEYSSDSYSCPCSTTSSNANPAHYVGNNYFCETGTASYPTNTVYSNDPLWDGQGCVKTYSQCECTFNSPPWFSVSLPFSTTDDIEVRICGYYNTSFADTPVALLELFTDVV